MVFGRHAALRMKDACVYINVVDPRVGGGAGSVFFGQRGMVSSKM